MRPHLPALSESRRLRASVFFGLYAVEGIPSGFALTAVANALTARGVDSELVGLFAARIGIPWSLQFLWGPIIDRFQGSAMGRRKPWVLGAQFAAFLASLGLLAVDDPVGQLTLLSWMFALHGLFSSVQDASVDAMAIAIIPEGERSRVNAFMRAGLLLGSGAGAALWATLIDRYGFRAAAAAQSITLLAMTAITAFVRERPGDSLLPRRGRGPGPAAPVDAGPGPDRGIARVFAELFRGFFAPRSFAVFAAVVSVYTAGAVFIRAYSWNMIHALGWSDEGASVLSGTGGTAVGLGTTLVGAILAERFGARRLLLGVMGLVGAFLVALGLAGPLWSIDAVAGGAMACWYAFDPAFSVACMPILMGLCRPGVEGSQFTATMSLVNLANAGGTYASGLIQETVSAPTIGLACGLFVLALIPPAAIALRPPRPTRD